MGETSAMQPSSPDTSGTAGSVTFQEPGPNGADRFYDARLIAVAFAFGVATDFFVNGVLKILWISIYGTVYLALAATMYNYLIHSRWENWVWKIVLGFLAGTMAGHLVFTGWTQMRSYSMHVLGDHPVILESADFTDHLIVTSENVEAAVSRLGTTDPARNVGVQIQVIENYGCITSFRAVSVAGIDVNLDPDASWVWKSVKGISSTVISRDGMHAENERLPWCRIQWF